MGYKEYKGYKALGAQMIGALEMVSLDHCTEACCGQLTMVGV